MLHPAWQNADGEQLPTLLPPAVVTSFCREHNTKKGTSAMNSAFQAAVVIAARTVYVLYLERDLPFIWNENCAFLVQIGDCSQAFCGTVQLIVLTLKI